MAIILIILTALVSYLAFQNREIFERYKFNAYLIYHKKDYVRLLSHGFLHADWMHLIFNMLVLYFFGPVIENTFIALFSSQNDLTIAGTALPYGKILGRLSFLVFYLSAIVVASLVSLVKHKNHHYYNSVGASGAVSAMVFAFILFAPLEKICLWGVLCFPGIIWGLVYLGYSYYQTKQNNDNINHDAHFIGSVYGFTFPLLIEPQLFLHFIQQLIS